MAADHEDDWMKSAVCWDCYAVPCKCSLLTRLLERVAVALGAYLRRRNHARQIELKTIKEAE